MTGPSNLCPMIPKTGCDNPSQVPNDATMIDSAESSGQKFADDNVYATGGGRSRDRHYSTIHSQFSCLRYTIVARTARILVLTTLPNQYC
jgi:hypothetical protein